MAMHSRSYVVVTASGQPLPGRRELRGAGRGHRAAGRHRLGAPGRVPRYSYRSRRPAARGRHRVTGPALRPSTLAAAYGALVMVLGTLIASGWFAATGAAALAQMAQP